MVLLLLVPYVLADHLFVASDRRYEVPPLFVMTGAQGATPSSNLTKPPSNCVHPLTEAMIDDQILSVLGQCIERLLAGVELRLQRQHVLE